MAGAGKRNPTKYKGVYWYFVKTPDGRNMERQYIIIYRPGGRDTKQIEEIVGTTGKGMTEAKANMIRALRIQGKEQSNRARRKALEIEKQKTRPVTFEDLFERYKTDHSGNASIRTDISNYKNYLSRRLSGKLIADIETADLTAIRQKMERLGKSAQTQKHVLGLIRRIIRYGAKMSLCSMPQNLIFETPRVDNIVIEMMDDDQRKSYLEALNQEADQDKAAFLKICLLTGIRKGALLGLQWEDIDFEHGLIRLRGENAKSGKTSYLPLGDEARKVLHGINRTDSPYIWPGKNGEKREDFRRVARRVKRVAGLPDNFRPCHGLRHSFASFLANSGKVDLYTLQKLLTHSSPQVTGRYAHLCDEALARASAIANGILQGTDKGE